MLQAHLKKSVRNGLHLCFLLLITRQEAFLIHTRHGVKDAGAFCRKCLVSLRTVVQTTIQHAQQFQTSAKTITLTFWFLVLVRRNCLLLLLQKVCLTILSQQQIQTRRRITKANLKGLKPEATMRRKHRRSAISPFLKVRQTTLRVEMLQS